MANFKVKQEVEILISSSNLHLYAGHIATIVDIIVDGNGRPVLAVIQLHEPEIDEWNKGIGFYDNGLRNISFDHIRSPK